MPLTDDLCPVIVRKTAKKAKYQKPLFLLCALQEPMNLPTFTHLVLDCDVPCEN